jgi:alkylated DNA repair dioxygenase AlkB
LEAGLPDQLALFSDTPALPDGLRYSADFISHEVERELVMRVAALPLQPFQFGLYEGKRRVASFGWRYDYSQRRLLPAEPFPGWLTALIRQSEAFGGSDTRIDQVLCTEYEAGVGIG